MFYTYIVIGDASAKIVLSRFGIHIESDLSLKNWYLAHTDNLNLINSEVIIENVEIKLYKINEKGQCVFLIKNLNNNKCVDMDIEEYYSFTLDRLNFKYH